MVLKLHVVQSVWPTRTSLQIHTGPWDTLTKNKTKKTKQNPKQVAQMDQGAQSITNHRSKNKGKLSNKEWGIHFHCTTSRKIPSCRSLACLPILKLCLASREGEEEVGGGEWGVRGGSARIRAIILEMHGQIPSTSVLCSVVLPHQCAQCACVCVCVALFTQQAASEAIRDVASDAASVAG